MPKSSTILISTVWAAVLVSLLLGGPALTWVRAVYTRLSGTNDRAPFRPDRTDFPVAANETAADMLCCALYPRIQTFPSTDLHLHGGGLVSNRRRDSGGPRHKESGHQIEG